MAQESIRRIKNKDLSHISDKELLLDYFENERDLNICRIAIKSGITHYQSGEPVSKYIEIGEGISKVIKTEMEKRGLP